MDMTAIANLKKNTRIPVLAPGDTVKVHVKVIEKGEKGDKERIQVFQGVVIKVRGGGPGASFTVRRVTYGIGVERIFPYYSPLIDKVEITRHGKVRRAKLYYLRTLSGKASRIKEKRGEKGIIEQVEGEPAEATGQPEAAEQAAPEPAAEQKQPPAPEAEKPSAT